MERFDDELLPACTAVVARPQRSNVNGVPLTWSGTPLYRYGPPFATGETQGTCRTAPLSAEVARAA